MAGPASAVSVSRPASPATGPTPVVEITSYRSSVVAARSDSQSVRLPEQHLGSRESIRPYGLGPRLECGAEAAGCRLDRWSTRCRFRRPAARWQHRRPGWCANVPAADRIGARPPGGGGRVARQPSSLAGCGPPRGTLSGLCGPVTFNPLRVAIVGCGARLFSGLGRGFSLVLPPRPADAQASRSARE